MAVLFYFHLECVKEREDKQAEKDILVVEFKPDETDVTNYPMVFSPHGAEYNVNINFFMTVMPCPLKKMLLFVCGEDRSATKKKEYSMGPIKDKDGNVIELNPEDKSNHVNITIHDARKMSFGGFHESGFTLVKLEEELDIIDWRTAGEGAQIQKFHRAMEPHIKKMYPNVKRMQWTYNVVRGGDGVLDQPRAVDVVHIDYHQNHTEKVKFHEEFTVGFCPDPCEAKIMLGQEDNQDGEFKILLGVWKPIHPAEVCDFPLAMIDARTFNPEDQGLSKNHFSLGFGDTHILGGLISHSPAQRWAYYPFQTTKEVLIFHQYSKDKFFANPHSSFHNTNCPKGVEERVSVEMRLALYF